MRTYFHYHFLISAALLGIFLTWREEPDSAMELTQHRERVMKSRLWDVGNFRHWAPNSTRFHVSPSNYTFTIL